MYNEIKETTKQPALLASIVGLINPATIIPIIAVGSVALAYRGYAKSKKARKENERLRTANEALQSEVERLEEGEFEPLEMVETTAESTVQNMTDEALKKEMIRQTMSELGKRSAEKRNKDK